MKQNLMKHAFLASLLLVSASLTRGQELIGRLYQAKVPIIVKKAYFPWGERVESPATLHDSIGRSTSNRVWDSTRSSEKKYNSLCEARKGYIFEVIDIRDKSVIIRWWDFRDSTGQIYNAVDGMEFISFANSGLDYEITLADLNSKCDPYFGNTNSFTWGAITMPIKLRLGNKANKYFSFQESLNIGIAAGWSWQKQGKHQKSTNALFSVGVSNVALDSLDFKKDQKNEYFRPNVKTTAAISIAGGYVFQFENFQVGAFLGIDMLPYNLGRQWLHNGKPWFGIGLGMSLFNRNQQSNGTGKNEESK